MVQDCYEIVVVEPYDPLRNALLLFLDTCEDLKVVGSAVKGWEAGKLCSIINPDVMLIEIQLPDMDGIELIRQLKRQHPRMSIVVLTASLQEYRMRDAIEAGAVGFLEKGVPIEVVIQALRLAGQQALKRHL